MKITIDTKEDSHSEIAKVIKMLQNLIGDVPESGAVMPSEPTPSLFNIFGNSQPEEKPKTEEPEKEPEEEKELSNSDFPEIQLY